jgi:hypothetical protein
LVFGSHFSPCKLGFQTENWVRKQDIGPFQHGNQTMNELRSLSGGSDARKSEERDAKKKLLEDAAFSN